MQKNLRIINDTMNNIIKVVPALMTLISMALLPLPLRSEPPNLSLVIKEVQAYHDSGQYAQDLAQAIGQAQQYIIQQALLNEQQNKKKKLAIVLDIDETSLSNYQHMLKRNFGGSPLQIHRDILAANAPAITPMLALYRNALQHGVHVFFVTGRRLSELTATRSNLLRAGFKHWAGLYLRPDDYHQASIIPFKAQARESISRQGYTILAAIGDQESDLEGGFAQKGFKLPNPFYHLP